MNIIYVSFPDLGFQGKNLCVMFVFSIVSFLNICLQWTLYKVRIYILYQIFIGFRGMSLWSRVWLRAVISLVTVGDLRYCFSGEKKWQAI